MTGWMPIAHKDINDAGRSRLVWVILAGFTLGFLGYVASEGMGDDVALAPTIEDLAVAIALVLPVIALLLGYKSIAHERINGSIVLLLSFPHSRADLVLGKYVGRSVVLLVPLVCVLGVAGLILLVFVGARNIHWYLWFVLVTVLYGLVFLSVALAILMSMTGDRRITLGAFGSYLLLVSFWDNLVTTFVVILYRFDFDVLFSLPSWAYLAHLLKPSEAYYRLLRMGFETGLASQFVAPEAPWFVGWWMAFLILVGWIVFPVLVGYWRFVRADLLP